MAKHAPAMAAELFLSCVCCHDLVFHIQNRIPPFHPPFHPSTHLTEIPPVSWAAQGVREEFALLVLTCVLSSVIRKGHGQGPKFAMLSKSQKRVAEQRVGGGVPRLTKPLGLFFQCLFQVNRRHFVAQPMPFAIQPRLQQETALG